LHGRQVSQTARRVEEVSSKPPGRISDVRPAVIVSTAATLENGLARGTIVDIVA
jgi:hypothetical protein